MRAILLLLPAVLMAQAPQTPQTKPAAAQTAPAASAAGLNTDEEKTIYAIGLALNQQYQATLSRFGLSPAEAELVKRGFDDAAAGKPAVQLAEWGPKIGPFATTRTARIADQEKTAGKAYMEKAAAEPGTIKTDSGMLYREITAGKGESPKATDRVKVQYRGTLINGTEFDSSYKRNQPAEFALNQVIPCWTEGVQKMKVGGKAQLVCPSDLAYKDMGSRAGAIPGGATLVFEVELLEIVPAPAATAPVPGAPVAQPKPAAAPAAK